MKNKLLYLSIIVCIINNSCEYTPTGSYFKEVTFTQPNIDLIVSSEDDTIVVRGHKQIPFSAVLDDKNLIAVRVYLNGNLLGTYTDPDGAVDFNSTSFTDGFYDIKFEMFTTTNTGSLADLNGLESYVLTKNYTLQVFNAPIITPQITQIKYENHALRIKWDKYSGPGFIKYILLAYNEVLAEIYDQNITEIADPAYVGGLVDRAIRTDIAGDRFESDHNTVNNPQTKFVYAINNGIDQIILKWERNNYDSAFGKYQIRTAATNSDFLVDINDINTISIVDSNPIFGSDIHYDLMCYPKPAVYVYYNPSRITAAPIGQSCTFPQYSYIKYISGLNSYYGYYDNTLRVHDSSMNLIKSKTYSFNNYTFYNFTNNSTGELIYALNGGRVVKINSVTLNVEKTYNMDSLSGLAMGSIQGIQVSDDNKLAVICSGSQLASGFYIFDMNTETFLSSQYLYENSYSYDIQISKNGNYIRAEDNLYWVNGNKLHFIGNVQNYSYFLNNSENLVQFTDNKVQKLKCSDLSLLSEISIPKFLHGARLRVDDGSNYVGLESSNDCVFYILDMQANKIKKMVPIVNYWVLFQYKTLFCNNRMLKLNI